MNCKVFKLIKEIFNTEQFTKFKLFLLQKKATTKKYKKKPQYFTISTNINYINNIVLTRAKNIDNSWSEKNGKALLSDQLLSSERT